jgi:hypothetical protein
VFTRLSRHGLLVAIGFVGLLGSLPFGQQRTAGTGELDFLRPWFEADQKDREKLAQRGVVVRALPGADRQIGVIAVTAISIGPDAFVSRMRADGGVKHAELLSGHFSDPPVLEDLAPISLDAGDMDRLRRLCRPGDCRLNLADDEMTAVQRPLASNGPGASAATQQAFRQVVLDRTRRYLKGGLEALPEYHDRSTPVRPAAIFSEILRHSHYLRTRVPRVASYLEKFPNADGDHVESFLRWSRAVINDKAVIMVSHVSIVRPAPAPGLPAVLVTGKQVYASRYMNGELTMTMLFGGEAGSPAYLVHVNRSELDELGGSFSGIKRSLIVGRIKHEAVAALAALRDGLERAR